MLEKPYVPSYAITDTIIHLVAEIGEPVGAITIKSQTAKNPQLRRDNQIRSIHSSLAIENNALSLDRVTDVINGKRVLSHPSEREVRNVYKAYNLLLMLNPYSVKDMLKAHKVLMTGLSKESGRVRSGDVGVFTGMQVVRAVLLANDVPKLIDDLVNWVKDSETHPLIKSCVFHYEFAFIHPFADGNGRMGRMWQTLILPDGSRCLHGCL